MQEILKDVLQINSLTQDLILNELLVGAHTEQPQLLINGPKLIKCVLQEAGSTVDSLLTQAEYCDCEFEKADIKRELQQLQQFIIKYSKKNKEEVVL